MEKLRYYLSDDAVLAGCVFEQPIDGDAGYDICASEESYLFGRRDLKGTNHRAEIKTGLYLEIPDGYVGLIRDRSSMARKVIYTHGGVIDSSYRGEILVMLDNQHFSAYKILAGQKIAQIVIVPVLTLETEEVSSVDDLEESVRGDDGFGSTGE
jgi:dUTP pyrophosphatase